GPVGQLFQSLWLRRLAGSVVPEEVGRAWRGAQAVFGLAELQGHFSLERGECDDLGRSFALPFALERHPRTPAADSLHCYLRPRVGQGQLPAGTREPHPDAGRAVLLQIGEDYPAAIEGEVEVECPTIVQDDDALQHWQLRELGQVPAQGYLQ